MKRSYQLLALRKDVQSRFQKLRSRIPYRRTVVFLRKRPFVSFFIALGLLLLVIVTGKVLGQRSNQVQAPKEIVKSVQTYTLGKTPEVTVQAKVEKTGIVKILAQTSGVVQTVHIKEGESVSRGQAIMTLSSNYQGGNAPGIQAQIAQEQYKNILQTFDTQKNIIATQRDLANTSSDNAEQLRTISERSLGDTQELLRYNENMLMLVNQAIGNAPSDSQASQFTNPLQQSRAQLLGTVVQVRAQLRMLEHQADTNAASNKLTGLQKDVTLKQLDTQEKALEMQREVGRLQTALAGINASLMQPASPFTGVLQRVFVRPGQTVSPGTPIAIVSQNAHAITAVANVPYAFAKSVSATSESTLSIGGKQIKLTPSFVSTDATDGQLYSVKYELPVDLEKQLTDEQTITVNIPVGDAGASSAVPFIPLDAVYQTQDESLVYVLQDGRAKARKVTLGNVFGRFVEVEKGVTQSETIILTRNVVENDQVRVQE